MNRAPETRPSPPVGEKVPGGRLRGIATGSWLRFMSGFLEVSPSHEPGRTSNIEHPTPNIEWQANDRAFASTPLRMSAMMTA